MKTTTGKIEFIENKRIIVNKFVSKSAFKKVYLLESKLAIHHMIHQPKIPILIDITRIDKIKLEDLTSLICSETTSVSSSLAILTNAVVLKNILNFWYGMVKPACPVIFFDKKEDAIHWLKS